MRFLAGGRSLTPGSGSLHSPTQSSEHTKRESEAYEKI
jgi:hypothetical protein